MKPAAFLLSLLLLAVPAPRALAETREANIFYYDNDFMISFVMSSSLEEAAKSNSSLKILSVASGASYTDGRRFVTENPQNVTLAELNATTDYNKLGETEIIVSGRSFLSSSAEFPAWLQDLLLRVTPPAIVPRRALADKVRGVTPQGKTFICVELRDNRPNKFWSYTMNISYFLDAGGARITVTESCFPMGLNGFSRRVRELSADKSANALISLDIAGRLMAEVMGMPAGKAIERLAAYNTDIAALHQADLKYLWEGFKKGEISVSTGLPALICSNIKITDRGFSGLVRPYAIRDLNGIRTAFISFIPSNSDKLEDLSGVPIVIKNPAEAGAENGLIDTLRREEKAVLVVAVSHLNEDLSQLMEIPGIDIVIGPKSWEKAGTRRSQINLSDWDKEMHSMPGALIFRDSRGLGELNLVFSETGALKSLRSQSVPLTPDDFIYSDELEDFKEKIVQHFMGAKETLLPDMRKLRGGSGQVIYSQLDVKNIMVSLLRKEAGTELAFMKIQTFNSSMLGEISASMVKSWLGQDDRVVKAWIPGSLINALRPKFDFRSDSATSMAGRDDRQKYFAGDYFAVSGVTSDGLISGLPVKDSEFYLAAFPEKFLKEEDKYPQLKNIRVVGRENKTLNTLVLADLERIKKESAGAEKWEASIKDLVDNKPAPRPIWRLNIRDISLQTQDTRVRNTDNFSQVSDSRLRTTRQTLIQGSGSVFSEYYKGNMRLDSGVSADYGKMTLRPKDQPRVETESVDQIILENELKYKFLRYKGFLGSMLLGPFFNLAYDTEFTHQTDLPTRKIVRGRAGLKLFEGAYLRELYTGLVSEQNYTNDPARTNYAAEAGFGVNMLIPGTALTLDADGNYRYFADSRFDTAADLKRRLELNLKLSTKLYGDVMISPFFNFFLATDKMTHTTATNIMTGVSLNYSRLFKLKY